MLESLNDEVLSAKEAVVVAKDALAHAVKEEANRQMEVGSINALYEEARQDLDKMESLISQLSSEISNLKHKKSKAAKAVENSKLESKKLSIQIERMRKERLTAEKEVSNMIKKHSWIESEKAAFGVRGGDYDFEETDPIAMRKTLQDLQSEQEALVSGNVDGFIKCCSSLFN